MSRIGLRFSLVTGCVTLSALMLLTYIILEQQETEWIEEEMENAEGFCETILRSVQFDMLQGHSSEIHEIMKAVAAQSGVKRVRLLNKSGQIVFSTDESEIGSSVDMAAEACYVCHSTGKPLEKPDVKGRARILETAGGRVVAVVKPIHNSESCWSAACHAHPKEQRVLGVLDVAISLVRTDLRLASNQSRIVLFSVVTLFAILGAVWLFVRIFVTKPVRELTRVTEQVAAGDLDVSAEIPSHDEMGQLARSFNIMTEKLREHVARLQETQQLLFQSEKLAILGRMSASVAHEVNSPLTTIMIRSKMLYNSAPEGSKEKRSLAIVVDEARRCKAIIQRLLSELRVHPAHKVRVNVNRLILETIDLVRRQFPFRNIRIVEDMEQSLPEVEVDANQIKQVFLNLLVNAAHAMPQGGTLTVYSLCRNDRQVEVKVSDTGDGIPEENLDKVFTPFFTTKEDSDGTGLGLAVCAEIIEIHGGSIQVESERKKGTIFTIVLPANARKKS